MRGTGYYRLNKSLFSSFKKNSWPRINLIERVLKGGRVNLLLLVARQNTQGVQARLAMKTYIKKLNVFYKNC